MNPISRRIKIDSITDCWEWQGARQKFGHGCLTYRGRGKLAHRLAWEIFRGEIPKGLCVLHKCDNPPCCNPNHLFLGTRADNAKDCAAKGRTWKRAGAENPRAKLSSADVLAIREAGRNGVSGPQIARQFGISRHTAWDIIAGRTWTHLKEA